MPPPDIPLVSFEQSTFNKEETKVCGYFSDNFINFKPGETMKCLFVSAVACLVLCQLISCNGASVEKVDAAPKGLPILILRQSSSSSSQGSSKPDFWLMWLQPYEGMIPKPVMDAIDQNVRPQTEQATAQIISQVPGGDQVWSMISQFQNTLNNMGGLQSLMGSMGGMGGLGGSGGSGNSGSSRRPTGNAN